MSAPALTDAQIAVMVDGLTAGGGYFQWDGFKLMLVHSTGIGPVWIPAPTFLEAVSIAHNRLNPPRRPARKYVA